MALYLTDEKKWLYFFHGYGRIAKGSLFNHPSFYKPEAIASEKAALENFRNLSLVSKTFHCEIPEILLGSQRFSIKIQHSFIIWRHIYLGWGPIIRKDVGQQLRSVAMPDHIMNCLRKINISLEGFKGTDPRYGWSYSPCYYHTEWYPGEILAKADRGNHCLRIEKGQLWIDSFWGAPVLDENFDGYDRYGRKRHSQVEVERYRQAIVVLDPVFEHLRTRTKRIVDGINMELRGRNTDWSREMLDRDTRGAAASWLG